MEVLAAVTFYPTLTLRNPEPWQLHLLAATLQLLAIRQQRASWPRDRDSLFRQYLREVEQVVDVADRLVLSGDSVG